MSEPVSEDVAIENMLKMVEMAEQMAEVLGVKPSQVLRAQFKAWKLIQAVGDKPKFDSALADLAAFGKKPS